MTPTDPSKPVEPHEAPKAEAPPRAAEAAPSYEATVRLIRSRLADEERTRAKRWWRFLK